jgi:hypothetical protein
MCVRVCVLIRVSFVRFGISSGFFFFISSSSSPRSHLDLVVVLSLVAGGIQAEWVDGQPQGLGIRILGNGQRYAVNWRIDPTGHGVWSSETGSTYIGKFESGCASRVQVLTFYCVFALSVLFVLVILRLLFCCCCCCFSFYSSSPHGMTQALFIHLVITQLHVGVSLIGARQAAARPRNIYHRERGNLHGHLVWTSFCFSSVSNQQIKYHVTTGFYL